MFTSMCRSWKTRPKASDIFVLPTRPMVNFSAPRSRQLICRQGLCSTCNLQAKDSTRLPQCIIQWLCQAIRTYSYRPALIFRGEYTYGLGIPQFPHPFGPDSAYGSPRQPPPPAPAHDHYDNPSPPAANPLQRGSAGRVAASPAAASGLNLSRQSVEKEPHSATPGNDRESILLPSPIIRDASRASHKSPIDSAGSVYDNSDNVVDDREPSETANPADLLSAGSGENGRNAA